MKCRKVREWIGLEMDGQLAPQHVASLQDHLEFCEDCRRYRTDLLLGQRLLQATEPSLPENFDWKLQLGLKRTIREAARDVRDPWNSNQTVWRRWLSRAGVSAAVGLAAVLTVAIVVPGVPTSVGRGSDTATVIADPSLRLPMFARESPGRESFDRTRRSLEPGSPTAFRPFGSRLQRNVSNVGGFTGSVWTSPTDPGFARIRQLEQEAESMRRRLFAKDRHIEHLQAQLDSLKGCDVDRD